MQHDAVLLADQPALRTAFTPSRSPPQRSLSSPDMSRFKFRLTLTKPPVHPTSSGKIRRQLSLTDSIDDDGALLKSTSDRHCEQERLFHQLDQKLNLEISDSGTVPHATSSKRTPFPPSPAAMQQGWTSSKLNSSAATHASASTHQRPAVKLDQPSPLNLAVHDQMPETLHESTGDDVCQPGTPIRREDSIPVRAEEHQLIGEAVFAALYEQTNVLLRNLHFERISRRASTS